MLCKGALHTGIVSISSRFGRKRFRDSLLDLFDSGHLKFATATSIRFSPGGFKRLYDGWENYAGKLLLRSQQVSNSPKMIRRLGVFGMNTPVEVQVSTRNPAVP